MIINLYISINALFQKIFNNFQNINNKSCHKLYNINENENEIGENIKEMNKNENNCCLNNYFNFENKINTLEFECSNIIFKCFSCKNDISGNIYMLYDKKYCSHNCRQLSCK